MTTLREQENQEALDFYREALQLLQESGAQYMLGGAFAIFHHTGIFRNTKDLDVFCPSSEYPKILKYFASKGYRTELTDIRWLAKIFKDNYYIDILFDTPNSACHVDEEWLQHAHEADFMGFTVKMLAPEELIWCKIYVQNRERFDGADINHVLLKQGKNLDWKRLARKMDLHWHLFTEPAPLLSICISIRISFHHSPMAF